MSFDITSRMRRQLMQEDCPLLADDPKARSHDPLARALLLELADIADERGKCFSRPVTWLAKVTGMSDRTVEYKLALLEQHGWISRTKGTRGKNGKWGRSGIRINIGRLARGVTVARRVPQPGAPHADGPSAPRADNSYLKNNSFLKKGRKEESTAHAVNVSFRDFCALWPQIAAKDTQAVWRAFRTELKHVTPEVLIREARRYTERGGTRSPVGWLRQHCWQDDPAPPTANAPWVETVQ
jgi:hypothetical protein